MRMYRETLVHSGYTVCSRIQHSVGHRPDARRDFLTRRAAGVCPRARPSERRARARAWREGARCGGAHAVARSLARTVLVIKRLVTDLKLTMVNAELYRAALITRLGSVRLGERLIFSGRWRATAKAGVKELDLLQVQQRGGGSRMTAVLVKGGTQ